MAAPALIDSVHHVSFLVDDLPDALGFYRDLLGCEQIDRPPLDSVGAWLRIAGTEVHLIVRPDGVAAPPRPPSPDPDLVNHVAFGVEDLDVSLGRLADAGYEIRRGSALPQAFVLDPSGNLIELNQYRRQ